MAEISTLKDKTHFQNNIRVINSFPILSAHRQLQLKLEEKEHVCVVAYSILWQRAF